MTIAHSLSVYQSHFVVGTGKVMCVKSSVKQVVGPQDRCLMITKHQLHISTYWTGTRFGGLECHFAQPIRASHRHSNLKKDIFFKYTCVTLFLNYNICIALLKSILRFFTCRSYKVDCRTSKFLFTTRDEFFFPPQLNPNELMCKLPMKFMFLLYFGVFDRSISKFAAFIINTDISFDTS